MHTQWVNGKILKKEDEKSSISGMFTFTSLELVRTEDFEDATHTASRNSVLTVFL